VSPTVRIDDEVYETLKANAEPFVDTPNTVLRRLLGLNPADDPGREGLEPTNAAQPVGNPTSGVQAPVASGQIPSGRRAKRSPAKGKATKRTRVPSGALLPEDRYVLPLLSALVELGGSAPYRQVVDRVGELLKGDLTDLDLEPVNSGNIRWQNRLQFVRLRLVQEGRMTRESGRGVWAISDEGRKYLEEHERGVA
jgi:hypothetical protein